MYLLNNLRDIGYRRVSIKKPPLCSGKYTKNHALLTVLNLVLLLLLSVTAGCGFSPIHAKNPATGSTALSGVEVMPVPGRNGQLLSASLEDLFNPEASGAAVTHQLETEITVDFIPVIIENDGTVSRYRIDFTAPISLRDAESRRIVFQDTVHDSVSYTVSESDYTSYVSSTDAVERGMTVVSHDITQRISAFLLKK